ncbi:hypothetical protein Ga0100231_008075 [Opitutaceae bacterium TAV4]|nr:hypothetical protein Ga0100231_008075 [Opitutaceae bacterium TAV4]RRJ98412.1 hypothetical protein Ga0100230_008375 [Opitutaceae bacterium TAV3]
MPFILRLVVMLALSYIAGSTLTPLLWGPVLARDAQQILSPFMVFSIAVLVIAVVLAVREWRGRR